MLRVFQIHTGGEIDTVCAENPLQALKGYSEMTDLELSDFSDDDDITEIPSEKWEEWKIKDEEGNEESLSEIMKHHFEFCQIASTVY